MSTRRSKTAPSTSQSKKNSSFIALVDKFLNPDISQAEIVQNAFSIQLQLAKYLQTPKMDRRKHTKKEKNNSDDEFGLKRENVKEQSFNDSVRKSFATKLIFVVSKLLEEQNQNSDTILCFIPSLLQKIDSPSQDYIQQLLQLDFDFNLQIPLFHAISEIPQSLELSSLFQQKIHELVLSDPKIASAALNICIFNFESQKTIQWANLARITFTLSHRSDLPNSSLLLRSKRTCSNELCNSICKSIQHVKTLDKLDFFLILILSSVNSLTTSTLLKYFAKNERLTEFSLKNCPLNIVPVRNIIDAIYTLSSSRSIKLQLPELSRIIAEAFVSSENSEILTFALFNEDENRILLDATIDSISLASSYAPQLFVSNFDSVGVLYSASKPIVDKLIIPLLKISIIFPQMFDGMIIFLRKMAQRPSRTEFAINSLCQILRETKQFEIQKQIVDIIENLITSPYIRSLVFRKFAKIKMNNNLKQRVKKLTNKYKSCLSEDIFLDLLSEESSTGLVSARDFPAALLELLLSLGSEPSTYFYLINLRKDNFNTESHFALQLALRADVYALLAPFDERAFITFCEYIKAIDFAATDEECKIISEWCSLKLDINFVRSSLFECKYVDPLYLYTIIRQISILPNIDDLLIQACNVLFEQTSDQADVKHKIQCSFLPNEAFEECYIQFREELTVEIAKYAKVGTLNTDVFIEEMKKVTMNGSITGRHCQAFLDIFEKSLPFDSSSANKMFDLLATLNFTDVKVFSVILDLAFSKSPAEDALIISNTLFACATGQDSTILLKKEANRNTVFICLSKFIDQFISKNGISEDILNLLYNLMMLEKINQSIISSVFKCIKTCVSFFVKIIEDNQSKDKNQDNIENEEFENIFFEFKEKCGQWFTENRQKAGLRNCGNCNAYLQMVENHLKRPKFKMNFSDEEEKGKRNNNSTKTMDRFIKRKWRSKVKWIDDALREESDSEDNYADLEGFIVDESYESSNAEPEEDTEEV